MREVIIARASVSLSLLFLSKIKVFSYSLFFFFFFAMLSVICILTDSHFVRFPRQHDCVKVNVFGINNFSSFYVQITFHHYSTADRVVL